MAAVCMYIYGIYPVILSSTLWGEAEAAKYHPEHCSMLVLTTYHKKVANYRLSSAMYSGHTNRVVYEAENK